MTAERRSSRLPDVEPGDLAVRNATYRLFVDLGRAPTAGEVGAETARRTPEVLDAWRRLHDAHAIVLDASDERLRMANPFSAVPTSYLITAAGRQWWANCAWDAFGVGGAQALGEVHLLRR